MAATKRTRNESSDEPQTTISAKAGFPNCLLVCPDFVLGTLSLTVTELVEGALAPFDLRLRHYQLLRLLYFDGPRAQSTIGPVLGVDRTSVVAILDHLESHGLAKRARSDEDRRAYVVSLTAKGRRLALKATTIVNGLEQQIFSPLSAAEQEVVRTLSARLLSAPSVGAPAKRGARSSGNGR